MEDRDSGFSDERLRHYLSRIREIAHLDEDKAIAATDRLLVEFLDELAADVEEPEEVPHAAYNPEDELERFQTEVERVRASTTEAAQTSLWAGSSLRDSAGRLASHWPSDLRKSFKSQIEAAKAEAYAVADQAEVFAHKNLISYHLAQPIHTIATVKNMVAELDATMAFLKKKDLLTDEVLQRIRGGKERAARFRFEKKRAEADVVMAGGNATKAERLMREAKAMLNQDWPQAFPGEQPPPV